MEALAFLLGIVLSLVALPISGAVAAAVHDSHTHLYASQASTSHTVTAAIIGDSGPVDSNGDAVAHASWIVNRTGADSIVRLETSRQDR